MKTLKTFLALLLFIAIRGHLTHATTYLQASKSANGPWSSDSLVIFTKDSLFLRFDVEVPGGSVRLAPIMDGNGNGMIDTSDFIMDDSSKIFMIDNGSVIEDGLTINDLDPALGTVIRYLPLNDAPSFRVMCRLLDSTSYKDIVIILKNPPADFKLSGNVYKPDGSPYTTAFASAELVGDTSTRIGSFTNYLGYYEIPLNAGTYRVGFGTMDDEYQGWDTTVTISGNLVINYTFKENNCYIRGYVRDQNQDPLDSVTVRFNGGRSVDTDSSGMYESSLPSGDNRVSIDKDWLRNNKYIFNDNNNHNFMLNANDSILDNSITNFMLYKTNSTISGKIFGQNLVTLRLDFHFSKDTFNLNGQGVSDTVTGNFMIDVYSGMYQGDTIKYWIGVSTDDNNYHIPEGFYVTPTGYNNILPGTDTLKFTLTPNELNFSDAFNTANGNTLDWNVWSSNYANSDNTWDPDSNNLIQIKDSTVYLSVIANARELAQQAISLRKGYSVNNTTYEFDMDASGIGNGGMRFSLFSSGSIYLGPTKIGDGEYNKTLFLQYIKSEGWNLYQAWVRDPALQYKYKDELLLSIPDTAVKVKVKVILSDNNKLKFFLNGNLKGEITWASFLNAGFPFFQLINFEGQPVNHLMIDNFMIYPDTLTTGLAKCHSVNLPVVLFPNPSSNIISYYIYSQEGGVTHIELINTLGVNVYSRDYSNPFSAEHKGTLDLWQLQLSKGVYFLKIRNSQGVFTTKVVYE